MDVIVELYKEWNEEISFAEIRDQTIDMYGRNSDWSKQTGTSRLSEDYLSPPN